MAASKHTKLATKKIDGDSHFFPDPDFTGVAETLGLSEQAIDHLLNDALLFSDREARRGGFRASVAGKKAGAINPTAASTSQGRGPKGHGIANHRVELLPETGFDMQVLIPDGIYSNPFGSPIDRDWDPGLRLALSMAFNNASANAQRQFPDQLIGTGVLPFGTESVESCVAEAERATKTLGLPILTINSNWRGKNWDSIELYPLWAKLNELKAPIYVHGIPFQCQVNDHIPTIQTIGWERLRRLHISNYLGFGFEYMVAMASLTLGGLLTEFPNLRFAFFEAGGSWLPWAMYTLDRVFEIEPQCARCDERPSDLIRKHCMVAIEPDETPIVGAIQSIGVESFIVGSDYPHPPSTFPNTAAGIEGMEGLSRSDKDAILGGNIARLLRI